ncbi:fasciclin domain-containing protein [Maribacter chungangensis]|uniref:Fasciclin domain-containing protein n=1 Tax=Maribacter chungangensis TaxID=1069117 RepID=A0ABW3B3U7_9FLAO
MKDLLKIFKPTLVAFLLIFAASCDDDSDDNKPVVNVVEPSNIVETAQGNNGLSSLVSALAKADESANNDLIAALGNEAGTFTVLAPSNDAFAALLGRLDGFQSLDDFNEQQLQDLLATILAYHVASGAALASTDLTEGQTITTLQGESITVSLDGGAAFIDAEGKASNVVTANVEATNGIVHVIDRVLLPQEAIDALEGILLNSITDLAIATPALSNLVAALVAADGDLPTVLAGDGPFTVFAPTNDAFDAFLAANGFADLAAVPVPVLTQILLNHVVAGANFSTDLTTGYVPTSSTAGVDGKNLSMFVDLTEGVRLNGVSNVNLELADIKATNGVVHVVDAVIGLPNIVDHALANSALTSLVGALTADGNTTFTDLLSNTEEKFTVFAPINSAFEAFENPNANEIANVLSNHVVVGASAFSADLTNSYIHTAAANADGDNLSLYINTDDGVTFNGSGGVVAGNFDIVATNGVVHAVSEVIDIPTVVTFAVADPTFAPLVTALTSGTPDTDFVATLSGAGPFTVFAPTDAAFKALLDSNMDWNEVADIDESLLTDVLFHHVVSGNVRSGDLTADGATVAPSLEGDNITITLPGTNPNIADVTDGSGATDIGIIAVDVQAGNGVIHVLNKVMIPDTTN